MRYSKSYQRTHDIDWFFRFGERLVHVATNGSELPFLVNDMKSLRTIQSQVAEMPYISESDVIINHEYVDNRLSRLNQLFGTQVDKNDYCRSFVDMAKKGFY